MGLFDDVKGAIFNAAEGGANGVLHNAISDATDGGLQGLLGKLQAGGLGEQVQSWISSGQNLPISADQLKDVLGNEHLQQIASSMGLPLDKVADALAEHLPGLAASTASS